MEFEENGTFHGRKHGPNLKIIEDMNNENLYEVMEGFMMEEDGK